MGAEAVWAEVDAPILDARRSGRLRRGGATPRFELHPKNDGEFGIISSVKNTMTCLLALGATICSNAASDGSAAQVFAPPPSKQGNALQALYAPSASNLQLRQPRHFFSALNPVADVAGAMSFCPE